MGKFAILEGNLVVNLIVAESAEIAETVTKKTAIESVDGNHAIIGGSYDPVSKKFIDPQPFPSWGLNSDKVWEAPIEMPRDGLAYEWDEESTSWSKVDLSEINVKVYPSWVLDEKGNWTAPVPVPDFTKAYVWDEETVSWKEDLS